MFVFLLCFNAILAANNGPSMCCQYRRSHCRSLSATTFCRSSLLWAIHTALPSGQHGQLMAHLAPAEYNLHFASCSGWPTDIDLVVHCIRWFFSPGRANRRGHVPDCEHVSYIGSRPVHGRIGRRPVLRFIKLRLPRRRVHPDDCSLPLSDSHHQLGWCHVYVRLILNEF